MDKEGAVRRGYIQRNVAQRTQRQALRWQKRLERHRELQRQIQKEAINMKKKYPFSFIIVYDDGKFNPEYCRPLSLLERYGNIVSLMQRYKVPLIECNNTTHFLKCIKAIISNVNKNVSSI